jgi:RNA polymerase sigma-70 factor (ECF subfamily)
MDEQEAIKRTLAGNREAYGHLVRTYHRRLYYYVVGKIPIESEAEDIVQRAFVTAFNKLHDFRPEQPFIAWLRGIALNHCRDVWRQHQRQAELKDRLLEIRRAELHLQGLEKPEVEQDRLLALRTCMESLDEAEQRAVHLRFVEERPLEEIGAELNKNSEAVRQFLFRIRVRLGACVKKRLMLHAAGGAF